ncbi:hypothetical protein DHEL01_v204871 [Diaporthe helianthi]|uniref:Methyltransferase domain-containing protein n=1 Tax=Diaporthe helianthi TaxID=158607 RepID=A0A2P5I2P3_DIAHE|nr:hypothetical protein DHEL01_v204871 [Diaporthe helianthi]
MARIPVPCVGSTTFDPATRVHDAQARAEALSLLASNDLAAAIKAWFQLPADDTWTYHAVTAVTLPQVQHIIGLGGRNGLHAWYGSASPYASPEAGDPTPPLPPPPPRPDIDDYIRIFQSSSLTSSALKALAANAKKASLRASVAAHLASKRFIHPGATHLNIPKKKKPTASHVPPNIYLDFWEWSCRNLEWCGPCPEAEARPQQSHHVLPIFMHHFGCAVPSYESLEILRLVAAGRTVVDVGSGNGYWTFMLRLHGLPSVVPIDNAQSEWRASWVSDTVISDGAKWLAQPQNAYGADMVLLMVYPVVGGGLAGGVEGSFTRQLVKAFKGDTLAVVGTQNRNGYTSFSDMTFDEYMDREQPAWTKVVQIPLPSFAGKDEALYVYQRGDRAAKLAATPGTSPA